MALPKVGVELVVQGLSDYLSNLRKGTEAVRGFGDTVSQQSPKINGFREIAIGAFRQVGALSVNLLGSAASSFVGLSRSGFEAVKSYETLSKSLEALTAREILRAGTAKDMAEAMKLAVPVAQENIRWLERLAIVSPYEVEDIAGAYRLGAALGFTSDQLKELISRTVDWGSATGQSGSAIERVMLALGQMNTKGKTTGEEMLQLVEAGVSAWDYLAQALGTNTQKAQELVSKGLVPAEFTIQAVAKGLGFDFQGAAEASAETLQGLTSSISDLANRALREAFTPALRVIQPYLVQLVDLLGSPAFLAIVTQIGSSIGVFAKRVLELAEGIATAQDPLQALIDSASSLHPVLGVVIKSAGEIVSYFIGMATGGAQVHQSLSNLPGPVQAVVGVLGQMIAWIRNTIQVFKNAEDSHRSWAGIVSQASSTVRAVSQAVSDYLQAVFTFIGNFIRQHGAEISQTLVAAWQLIAQIVTLTLQIVQTVVTSVLGAVSSFIQSNQGEITTIIRTAWDVISNVILAALTLIQGVLTAVLRAIQGDWRGAWDAIVSATREVVSRIQSALTSLRPVVESAFRAATEAVKQVWDGLVRESMAMGRRLIEGVAGGVRNAAAWLAEQVRSALQGALDEAKARLGIQSPSRYTAQILGVPLAEGIAQGILQSQAVISRAFQRVTIESARSSSVERSYTSNVSYTYTYAPTYMGGAPPVDVSFDVIRLSLAGGY
jgi:tape measure domain-containing protein